MALPIDVSTVTVTGTYLTDDGVPADGSLIFTPSVATLRDPAYDTIIKLRQQRIDLDVTGSFSVALIATDDPDLIPIGWHYDVTERVEGNPQRVWVLQLPYTLTTIDIADVPTSVDPSQQVYPAPVFAVTSVVGQIGDVTGAEILADTTVAAAFATKASDADLDTLAGVVATKASDADLDTLAGVVATKASDADLDTLAGVVATKANTSALTALVPYTGATGDVNLATNSLRAENVNVNEGTLTDPVVTDLGGLTVSVTTVDCLIRSDAVYGNDGWLYRATIPAVTLPVVDNTVNHLYVTWNSGTPVYAMTTNRSILNLSDTLPVARLLVQGGVVYTHLMFGFMGRSAAIRWLLREVRITDPVGGVLESGLGLSETATRVVNVSAGTAWFVLNHLVLSAVAQGGSGVTSFLLHHTAGIWTKTTITQYNNTQYDNGTNLATLTNNRYAVNWVYRSLSTNEIIIVLSTGDHSASDATASNIPVTPAYIDEFYILVGRIIVQKNASTSYLIENTSTTHFETGAVVEHNDLDGLQGGTTNEYYHLTAAQLASVGAVPAGAVPYTGATGNVDLGTYSLYADNTAFTEGVVTDPTITDAAGVAVAVTSCDVLVRSNSAWGGDERLYRMSVPATSSLAMTDNAVNYVYVTWNLGSPVYAATTDRYTINFSDRVPVARVGMESGTIEYQLIYGYVAKGATSRNQDRVLKTRGRGGIERESGLGLSESATRVVSIGSGYVWFGLRRISIDAVTSGVGGTILQLWYHSSGVWTKSTITQYNNTQYDNGTNLATLTANRYAVNWIYRNIITNEIDIILGTGDYTLAQAEASTLPAIPEFVAAFYVLCGRIIVQKSASTATTIENVVTTTFNQAAVSNHEDLSGLQGGTTGEHYHLTNAQHTAYGTATALTAGTPETSGATGTAGQVLYDTSYIYVCVATNTWRRATLNTF
jgi:hypothetical protein